MTSITEVARKANLSIATVSRVLNEKGYVSTQAKRRVLDAAKELDYCVNVNAKNLRTNRTNRVAFLVPDISNPFYPAVAQGIMEVMYERDYNTIFFNTGNSAVKEFDFLKSLRGGLADGAVVVHPRLANEKEKLNYLKNSAIPVVFIGRIESEQSHFDFVTVDTYQGAFQAVTYLIELGHKRVAFLSGGKVLGAGHGRLSAYKKALETKGIKLRKDYIVPCGLGQEEGYRAMKNLLEMKSKPTAVFCINDLVAIGALDAVQDQGAEVPGNMSIVGFDDIYEASAVRPRLTTVAQPKRELGREAARMLSRRLEKPGAKVEQKTLHPSLVVRDSTAPPQK